MPIYEFYCHSCNVIYNFFSSSVNTEKRPDCPKCGNKELTRQMSMFATLGRAKEDEDDAMLAGLDETKMEHAFESLMREAESLNEDDPRQMASLMRRFTSETGIHLGDSMEEAISRMEAGEDPEEVEKDLGDQLGEDEFTLEAVKKKIGVKRPPSIDETLYEL